MLVSGELVDLIFLGVWSGRRFSNSIVSGSVKVDDATVYMHAAASNRCGFCGWPVLRLRMILRQAQLG
jgi:hypothetical protein